MDGDFKSLRDFLDRFGPEVAGRGRSMPPFEETARLERFARGECETAERTEVCRLLQANPTWLRWLAERVKLSRAKPGEPQRA